MSEALAHGWRLVEVRPDDQLLDQVIALGRRNRARLGFLPNEAFRDRAVAGTLLALVRSDASRSLGAYALFDLVHHEISLRHLCVDEAVRGHGLARDLVSSLQRRHGDRRGVSLLCRRDYGLDGMWESLGFIPVSERPGRNLRGDPVTRWHLDFGQKSFFDWRSDRRIPFAIDSNVFYDLWTERETSWATREAFPDWLAEEIEVVVSDEILKDVNKVQESRLRRHLREAFQQHRQVRTGTVPANAALNRLKVALQASAIPVDPGESDLRQLSSAIAEGIQSFVTSDGQLLQHVGKIAWQDFGIAVLHPSDIVRRVDELRAKTAYTPVALANTDISLRQVNAGELDRLADIFLAKSDGERLSDFLKACRAARQGGAEIIVVEDRPSRPLALIARKYEPRFLDVDILRLATSTLSRTLAQHLLALQRNDATCQGKEAVRVSDPAASRFKEALSAEGYLHGDNGKWIATCCAVLADDNQAALAAIRRADVPNLVFRRLVHRLGSNQPLSPHEVAEAETYFSPLKILDASVTNLLVPIRPSFAEQLFDVTLSTQKLFQRPKQLGIEREQVYYKSPRFSSKTTLPARILWYVSGDGMRPGTRAVRACSILRSVEIDTPERLIERYRQLGVFTVNDVRKLSKNDGALAMLFTNTELFPHPIRLDVIRKISKSLNQKLILRSATPVTSPFFKEVYRLGTERLI